MTNQGGGNWTHSFAVPNGANRWSLSFQTPGGGTTDSNALLEQHQLRPIPASP
jgi:hypothetical protein